MAIELDNLKIEQLMGSDGDMWHSVIDTDTDEILKSFKELESAMNYAELILMGQQIKKEEA